MSNRKHAGGSEESLEKTTARRSVLRAGAGLAAAAVGVVGGVGTAAAHFPEELEIDVKPGDDDPTINPDSGGVTPVAVLQTDEFDPTDESVNYRFGAPDVVAAGGGARPAHCGHVEDGDGDGRDDLVLHFPTDEAGFDGDEEEARLVWEREHGGGHGFSGTDEVRVVGRSGRH